jgi:hypothetical protein
MWCPLALHQPGTLVLVAEENILDHCQFHPDWNGRMSGKLSSPSRILVLMGQCGLGLYVSGRAISEESAGGSFSCASNA